MRSRYGTSVAFIDMTLNALMGISVLFIVSFLLIREADKKTDIPEPPIMIMAVLTWPSEGPEANTDIDLWVSYSDDNQDAVGFRSPIREGIALELDDLGSRSDRFVKNGKTEVIKINREVINFRRIPPDEITINAMLYWSQQRNILVPAALTVYRMNPFEVIYEGSTTLTGRGDEHTFIRFKMDADGEVTDKNFRQKSIVFARHPSGSSTQDWPTGPELGPPTTEGI